MINNIVTIKFMPIVQSMACWPASHRLLNIWNDSHLNVFFILTQAVKCYMLLHCLDPVVIDDELLLHVAAWLLACRNWQLGLVTVPAANAALWLQQLQQAAGVQLAVLENIWVIKLLAKILVIKRNRIHSFIY